MRTLIDLFDECDRHLQALGEAMHRCPQPPRLYVAADGSREGRDGEAERVARVQ